MRVTLESTTKIVELVIKGQTVPARVWEGETASGVQCHAYITRIAVREGDNEAEFERELLEQRKPSAAIEAISNRLVV